MSHIFISYSHNDSAFANKLANDLLDYGHDVWIDSLNLPGGIRWDEEIMQSIDHCEYFLLLWSANMEGSDYSRKEKERALKGQKTIIPVLYSGDPSRMWDDIRALQWIDFRGSANDGWERLTTRIPLPSGINPPPDISALIAQEDMTFAGAARLWRSTLKYDLGHHQMVVGLLIERSEQGIYSYLAGEGKHKIQPPEAIQVFFNFSGGIEQDRFKDYLDYIRANETPLWTVLVRGPIASGSRGLEYQMPYDKMFWQTALQMAWKAVGQVGAARIPLHLYFNAPVALAAGFCAREHFRRKVTIYQIDLGTAKADDRYFLAYSF